MEYKEVPWRISPIYYKALHLLKAKLMTSTFVENWKKAIIAPRNLLLS